MIKYIFLLFLIIFTGCSNKQEVYISKKVYTDISKDAVLEAAKTLFTLSNKENNNKDFIIDSYRDKIEANKIQFEHHFFRINIVVDNWVLEVQQFDKETRANLVLVRNNDLDSEENMNINQNVHNLFWSRIDYLLGLENNWKFCSSYFSLNPLDGFCSGYFITSTPEKEYLIKDILITQRNNSINTIDTVKADIFNKTDLTLDKNYNNIFDQKDDILDTEMLKPARSDTLFEIKAPKKERKEKAKEEAKEEPSQKETDAAIIEEVINEKTVEKTKESQKLEENSQINKFKEDLENIINMKTPLEKTDSKSIISNSDELKENSEFDLKPKTQEK